MNNALCVVAGLLAIGPAMIMAGAVALPGLISSAVELPGSAA
ncbi:hypothetical protein [Kribbella sp. DT2]